MDKSKSNDIGLKLKKIREKRNLSQLFVAEKLNIDNSVLSKIENGKRKNIEIPLLEKFAEFYEVPISEFIDVGDKDITTNNKGNIFFFDMEGLSDEEIEDIKRHIEYVKWKAKQERG